MVVEVVVAGLNVSSQHNMNRKTITFTAVGRAELQDDPLADLGDNQVLVDNEFSAISAGTERACLLDMPNLGDGKPGQFPKTLGYSGVGRVVETGKNVQSVKAGDRVLTHWGSVHSNYVCVTERNLLKIEDAALPSEHAVFAIIAGFSLNGLRKTRLEMGESVAVVGMGLLGMFSLALARIAGGAPVIATDLSEERRLLAKSLGAHYTFDPAGKDYVKKVKDAASFPVGAVFDWRNVK